MCVSGRVPQLLYLQYVAKIWPYYFYRRLFWHFAWKYESVNIFMQKLYLIYSNIFKMFTLKGCGATNELLVGQFSRMCHFYTFSEIYIFIYLYLSSK